MDEVERVARAICGVRGLDAEGWRAFEHRALAIVAELTAARSSAEPMGRSGTLAAGRC